MKRREQFLGAKNPMFGKPAHNRGKPATEEAREKNRVAHLGKIPHNKGTTLPDEQKQKIASAKSGKLLFTDGNYRKYFRPGKEPNGWRPVRAVAVSS